MYGKYFYPANGLVPIAIFIDYDKYGKKYIESLTNRNRLTYRTKDFEGKYISEDGQSYLELKKLDETNFSAILETPSTYIYIDGYGGTDATLNRNIISLKRDDKDIIVIILDPDTFIIYENVLKYRYHFNGIYTRVKE